jgi:hypothetical protein
MNSTDITRLENVTYIQVQIASFYAELEAMKAENMQREHLGQSMAWDEGCFNSLIEKHGLSHNQVIAKLQEWL